MPHSLICGITESGKTTLAVHLCRQYMTRGIKTIVLDPLLDPRWGADFVTHKTDEFLEMVSNSRSCGVFLDESAETVGRYSKEMFWLATRARHYGHNTHFITQRAVNLNVTVRDQCSHLFAFLISNVDATTLARNWCKPRLEMANMLDRFEFFHAQRFGELKKYTVTLDGCRSITDGSNLGAGISASAYGSN